MLDDVSLAWLPEPLLVWGLLPRALGVVLAVAFASMIPQVLPLGGRGGIHPVAPRLARIAADFPTWRRFAYYPTVLWLGRSDAALQALPIAGLAGSLCAVYGGPAGWVGFAVCWVCMLSLEPIMNLVYPWDSMMLEASFLALLLPSSLPLPGLAASAEPLPLVALAFRMLPVRVMWGFAKFKFIGAGRRDNLYLKGFFANQPLPNPVGWLAASHAPHRLLELCLLVMFVAEVFCPGMVLAGGAWRLLGAAGLVALMLGIQLTGNFAFFNIGYIALSICLLDVDSSALVVFERPFAELWTSWDTAVRNGVAALLLCAGVIYFPLNSWATQTWTHWNFDRVLRRAPPVRWIVTWCRALKPLRVVNAYGVFPPHSSPPIKVVPVLEGSDDGDTWKPYVYHYQPSVPTSRPRFVAPHHPRVDDLVFDAGFGADGANFQVSLIGSGDPYAFSHFSDLDRLAQCILRGERVVKRLFANDPFPERPPKLMRVSTYAFTPCTLAERRATGNFWHMASLGLHCEPRGIDAGVFELPDPELFHPDHVHWKRRSHSLAAMRRHHRESGDLDAALCIGPGGVTAADVRAFWEELVPMLAAPERRGNWTRLADTVREVRERFGAPRVLLFERITARASWLLTETLDPYWTGARKPRIPIFSYFNLCLLSHLIVLDGREAVLAVLGAPERAAELAPRLDHAGGFYLWGVLRFDMVRLFTRKLRILHALSVSKTVPIPGLPEHIPFLAEQLYDPNAETLLECRRDERGLWHVGAPLAPARGASHCSSSGAPWAGQRT